MSKNFFDDKKIEPGQISPAAAGFTSQDFCDDTMTALSLQLVNTSQIQQKIGVSPMCLSGAMISAGWNTDLQDKKSFNNQKFDSAVFLRSCDFKCQPRTYLH